jgi:anti-sigma factor RsiW
MMHLYEKPGSEAALCNDEREEALNLYLDGELPFAEQPLLFAHLAVCDQCRRMMEAMMTFRRMSRQEAFPVPPAVDEAILGRLQQVKKRPTRIDRYWDRRPLWQIRATMSLRAAALAAMLLFGAGLMFPQDVGFPMTSQAVVVEQEQVEPANTVRIHDVLYVFYPGLTVEAPKFIEPANTDAY